MTDVCNPKELSAGPWSSRLSLKEILPPVCLSSRQTPFVLLASDGAGGPSGARWRIQLTQGQSCPTHANTNDNGDAVGQTGHISAAFFMQTAEPKPTHRRVQTEILPFD